MAASYVPHPAVTRHIPLVDALARAMGPTCEIVLHDLRHPSNSLIHIAGSVTGRSLGAPVTNIVLEALRESPDSAADIFNYRTSAPNGHTLRSSTIFIRASGTIVGALCVNIDVSPLEDLERLVAASLAFERAAPEPVEQFDNSISDVLDNLLRSVLEQVSQPPSRMSPEERLEAVASLEERGAFLIKGAVEVAATRLGVSKFTIYSYLQQIRATKALGNSARSEPRSRARLSARE